MWYTFMIIKSFSLYFTIQKSLRVIVQTVSNSTSQRWMLITCHTEITVLYGKYGYFNLKLSSLGRSLKTKRRLHWQWLLPVSQQQQLGDAWSMDVSEHQLTSCDVPVPWRAVYDTIEYSTAFMRICIQEDHQVCNVMIVRIEMYFTDHSIVFTVEDRPLTTAPRPLLLYLYLQFGQFLWYRNKPQKVQHISFPKTVIIWPLKSYCTHRGREIYNCYCGVYLCPRRNSLTLISDLSPLTTLCWGI